MNSKSAAAGRAPELFFSVVGPVGIDIEEVYCKLCCQLKKYDYELYKVRLSDIVNDWYPENDTSKNLNQNQFKRIKNLQKYCNKIRKDNNCNGILSLYGISKIISLRKENHKTERKAYFIRQLKNPDEFNILRRVYGRNFILISLYADRSLREDYLIKELGITHSGDRKKLIEKDRNENIKHGQNVLGTYSKASYFMTMDTLESDMKRFIGLLFSAPFITPRKDEIAMSVAYICSLRSADFNKQVGAVIIDDDGNILASGTNEVPKPGGGQYWEDSSNDLRDYIFYKNDGEHSFNEIKNEIPKAIFAKLQEQQEKEHCRCKSKKRKTSKEDDLYKSIRSVQELQDIIEYLRPVHAEESAICDAALRGVSLKNSTIYTTTYPCHLCVKKIIAVGIKRIIYIHPYPKSRAEELYEGMITDKPISDSAFGSSVAIESYHGLSPRRYQYLFNLDEKKRYDKEKEKIIEKGENVVYVTHESPLGYLIKEAVYEQYILDMKSLPAKKQECNIGQIWNELCKDDKEGILENYRKQEVKWLDNDL